MPVYVSHRTRGDSNARPIDLQSTTLPQDDGRGGVGSAQPALLASARRTRPGARCLRASNVLGSGSDGVADCIGALALRPSAPEVRQMCQMQAVAAAQAAADAGGSQQRLSQQSLQALQAEQALLRQEPDLVDRVNVDDWTS